MAKSKRAAKSKASSKAKVKAAPQKQAAKRQAPAAMQLHKVIEQLIDARQRGDYDATHQAAAALAAFHKRASSASLKQAAAEAQAVAGDTVMVNSLMRLGYIAARLRAQA
jgi:hypothetical protein